MKITALLLAGGIGSRMGHTVPKQFLPLSEKAIALYSLNVLLQIKEIKEVVVVCAHAYRSLFDGLPVRFAEPGTQRQDSVFNGLQQADPRAEWICTHDAARPFITVQMVNTLIEEGQHAAAASLAVPVKNTLKQITDTQNVVSTLDRSMIWEIQTPQLVKKDVLVEAFAHVQRHALSVTDDLSLVELIGYSPKLVLGSYQNIKITTPEDLLFAEWLHQKNTAYASPMMAPTIAAGKSSPIAVPSKNT